MSLYILPLLPLSEDTQSAIFSLKNKELNRSLASSPFLKATVANQLAQVKDKVTAMRALRLADDKELLRVKARENKNFLSAVLWNTLTPQDIIDTSLTHFDESVALVAFLNPNASLDMKKSILNPTLAAKMVEVGGFVGRRVVRAYSLFNSNTWMMDNSGSWSNTIRRAIGGSHLLTPEVHKELKKAGWAGWQSTALNPFKDNSISNNITTKELVSIGSSASDYVALSRSDLTVEDASAMISRGRPDAEPHIIAGLIDRFGISFLSDKPYLADTRINSVSYLRPAALYGNALKSSDYLDTEKAAKIISSDFQEAKTVISLANSWNGSFEELIYAAQKI